MTIHYHGTPLTPRSEMLKMAGKHFCVSFANPHDANWCLENGQSVMWDNGAFSLFTREREVDWNKYFAWLETRLTNPHWAVVPDVIGGDVADNLCLIAQWPFDRKLGAVVWHFNEPIDHLIRLVDLGFGKVCFGSAGAYWKVGSPLWAERADEAFGALQSRGLNPWIHMLRGLAQCGKRWPFASADSVNVARNFKTARKDPEQMARKIDAVQCPVRWTSAGQQKDLFREAA